MTRTPFPGFPAADLAFLTGLAAHNDREWFTAHRAVYDERLKPTLSTLIAALNEAFAARDLPLAGDPKRSVFRIHRDVRFSKDKKPYKTHVSATLTRDGQKLSPGLVYVHIEPEGGSRPAFDPETIDPMDPSTFPSAQDASDDSYAGIGPFVAAGFYLSERPHIDAFRRAIAADPKGWAAVGKALAKAGLELDGGEPVKRMPKGFEDQAGGPLEAALKRTRWLVRRPLTGMEIGGATCRTSSRTSSPTFVHCWRLAGRRCAKGARPFSARRRPLTSAAIGWKLARGFEPGVTAARGSRAYLSAGEMVALISKKIKKPSA